MTEIADELTGVDERPSQGNLPLVPINPPSEAEMAEIARLPSRHAVYRWMIQRLEERTGEVTDKQVAGYLDIDPGHFSRVVAHGSANFSCEKELQFMRLCGSGAPVWWTLHKIGLDATSVHPLESEYERQIRALQEENDRLRRDQEVISEFLRKAGRT